MFKRIRWVEIVRKTGESYSDDSVYILGLQLKLILRYNDGMAG